MQFVQQEPEQKLARFIPADVRDRSAEVEARNGKNIGFSLGYTINLNLPATSDPAVFDAIFKSLKENLLSQNDA